MNKIYLYTILVPTKYEDTQKPVSLKHHKEWDKYVLKLANGLTIFKSTTIGKWIYKGNLYSDRMIPVQIACTEKQIEKIAAFTKQHYRQILIMYYKISEEVYFV